MAIKKSEKQELLEKLNLLLKKQSLFQQEIKELQLEIAALQVDDLEEVAFITESVPKIQPVEEIVSEENTIPKFIEQPKVIQQNKKESSWEKSGISAEMEKFIGENLINKIGIAVLIIGVGIGTKYAIDNDLISPLVRIILGYLLGFGLAGFAIRLKAKYLNFSAVLFSGAMAIQYFITYAANSYYNLFPQTVAISIMVIITILTVALALYYNQQVIAHFGLVGAYVVPYILKEPFLNVTILLIYIAIINSGILFISTRKRWKLLNYFAFIVTWSIFISWHTTNDYHNENTTSLTFLSLFFIIFHLAFLSYKLKLKEKFSVDDVFFLIINAGMFFFQGIDAVIMVENTKEYDGLFTLINAIIYIISGFIIYKSKLSDRRLFYWTTGMAIAFITLAISVQFNNFVTAILWSIETAIIFWYGRSKKINVYEYISFALIFLTFIITATNWTSSYNLNSNSIDKLFTPIFNFGFLASFIVILAYSFIFMVNRNSQKEITPNASTKAFEVLFSILFLLILYFTFFTEISLYWNNIQIKASFEVTSDGTWEKQFGNLNGDITKFMVIWLINYTLLFATLLSFTNFRWLKNKDFDAFLLVINFFLILLFLGNGLTILGQLRTSYLHPELAPNFDVSINHLVIRYISLAFLAVLIYSTYRFVITGFQADIFHQIFEIALSIAVVWACSSELINWLSLSGSTELYKHWLSILWGAFSLILISYGIWKRKKHLRIFAIVLFSGTLIKLFFYDLTNLETIPKTLVFLFTGALLLIVSYLYNKYTKMIFDEN